MDIFVRRILLIFLLVLIFHLLHILSGILLPLFFALLVALMFQPLIGFLSSKHIPKWIIIPIIATFSLFVIALLGNIIFQVGSNIAEEGEFLLTRLEYRLNNFLSWINSLLNLKLDSGWVFSELQKQVTSEWVSSTAGGIFVGISSATGSFIMFAIYYVLLLSGMANYGTYLNYVAGAEESDLVSNFVKIQKSVVSYIFIKTLINIVTGTAVYLISLLFGVKFPFFWGFFAFVMNYIPNIGSFLATTLPALMAFVQFNEFKIVLLYIMVLTGVQFTIGNLVEPKIMGDRLKLNTLTVIFGLVFWGYIWGVPGMMLSVPLLVMIKLIFERFPSLQVIARIMGSPPKKLP